MVITDAAGLTLATACSQPGCRRSGKKAEDMNSTGRVRKNPSAIVSSALRVRRAIRFGTDAQMTPNAVP